MTKNLFHINSHGQYVTTGIEKKRKKSDNKLKCLEADQWSNETCFI